VALSQINESAEARKVKSFFPSFLTLGHSFAGQPFVLEPFQEQIVDYVFEADEDGNRKRRLVVVGMPRKAAKSMLASGIALSLLLDDTHDPSPFVVSAAADRNQAALVFNEARRMVLSNADLAAEIEVYRNELVCPRNGGRYKVISADAGSAQGLNCSAVIYDEFHVAKRPDLFEALTLGSASRNSPLALVISTAGYDLESPFGKLYQQGCRLDGRIENGQVMSGEEVDPTMGMLWWGPSLQDQQAADFDHRDPEVWRKYYPMADVMPGFETDYAQSLKISHESAFIRYKLNGWTSSSESFLPAGQWEKLYNPDRRLEEGEEVVLGFDGAWRGDSTALVAVSLEDFHVEVLGLWEAPDDPAWRTPADEVEQCVLDACERFIVREMAADPWRFEQSLLRLQEEHGVNVIEFSTNVRSRMVPATSLFFQLCMDEEISHDGHPGLARHLANAVLKETPAGALITKEHSRSSRKIDAAVATIVGISRAVAWREDEGRPLLDESPMLLL
jgi:phage terminase large subunit-like protein